MTNLADHMKASAEIKQHIDEAAALAKKLGALLVQARTTFEALKAFSPDQRFKIDAPYHLRSHEGSSASAMSMNAIIDKQIGEINATLGDRA